jgi:hypothetical protein
MFENKFLLEWITNKKINYVLCVSAHKKNIDGLII